MCQLSNHLDLGEQIQLVWSEVTKNLMNQNLNSLPADLSIPEDDGACAHLEHATLPSVELCANLATGSVRVWPQHPVNGISERGRLQIALTLYASE